MRQLLIWLAILGVVIAGIVQLHRSRKPAPAKFAAPPKLETPSPAPRTVSKLDVFDRDDGDPADVNAAGAIIGATSGGRCDGEWCWESPLPDGGAVSALWGSGANDIWAAGEFVSHFDGKRWSPVDVGASGLWIGLDGCSAADVWLASIGEPSEARRGASPEALPRGLPVSIDGALLHFDGRSWKKSSLSGMRVGAVWCRAHDDVWVAGERGRLRHFDGHSWTPVPSGASGMLFHFVVRTRDDAWLLGADSAVLHFDGARWSPRGSEVLRRAPSPTKEGGLIDALIPKNLKSAFTTGFAAAADDVWIAGYRGVFHWDGHAWSPADTGTKRPLTVLWGASRADLWAGGGRLLHYDGARWSEVKGAGARDVTAIWGAAPDNLWLASRAGMLRWDGRHLTRAAPSSNDTFRAIWAGGDEAWVAGQAGALAHLSGGSWRWVTADPKESFHHIFASGPDDVWLVGGKALHHWDGEELKTVEITLGEHDSLHAFSGFARGPEDYFLCASDGLFAFDGSDAQLIELKHAEGAMASCSEGFASGTEVWASFGKVLWHGSGDCWAPQPLPTKEELRDVRGTSASDVWVLDAKGALFHFDGHTWKRPPTPAHAGIFPGLYLNGADDAWAWGYEQKGVSREEAASLAALLDLPPSKIDAAEMKFDVLLHWDGRSWSTRPLTHPLTALGGGNGHLWLLGMGGNILRHAP